MEIGPVGKPWAIFKAMHFLSYMPETFSCDQMKRTQKDGFSRSTRVREGELDIFGLFSSDDLETCKVYLLVWSDWICFRGGYRVSKKAWSLEHHDRHPLIVFGRFFGRADHAPTVIIQDIFISLFRKPGVTDPDALTGTKPERSRQLILKLPGYMEPFATSVGGTIVVVHHYGNI